MLFQSFIIQYFNITQGLVPTHAYAILDVQFVHGKKLLQVKNPWSHLRWKGNFSANVSNYNILYILFKNIFKAISVY